MDKVFEVFAQYLGCHDEAGTALMLEHGYLDKYTRIGVNKAREHYFYLSDAELRACAQAQVVESFVLAKKKYLKESGFFDSLDKFDKYLSLCMRGTLDLCFGERIDGGSLRDEFEDENNDGADDDADSDADNHNIDGGLRRADFQRCKQFCCELIQRFMDSLNPHTMIHEHLSCLRAVSRDDCIDAIRFLNRTSQGRRGEQQNYVWDYCNEQGMDRGVYDARTRRLRVEWRAYREGPGQDLWQRLKLNCG